ncbi:hypothetical protein J6590_105834, partial [Homalodisca vitripennis]
RRYVTSLLDVYVTRSLTCGDILCEHVYLAPVANKPSPNFPAENTKVNPLTAEQYHEPGTYSATHVFTRFDASCPHCYSRVKMFLKNGWLLFISACLRSIDCTLAAIFSTTMTVAPLNKCLCVVYIFGTTSVARVHINKILVCV